MRKLTEKNIAGHADIMQIVKGHKEGWTEGQTILYRGEMLIHQMASTKYPTRYGVHFLDKVNYTYKEWMATDAYHLAEDWSPADLDFNIEDFIADMDVILETHHKLNEEALANVPDMTEVKEHIVHEIDLAEILIYDARKITVLELDEIYDAKRIYEDVKYLSSGIENWKKRYLEMDDMEVVNKKYYVDDLEEDGYVTTLNGYYYDDLVEILEKYGKR